MGTIESTSDIDTEYVKWWCGTVIVGALPIIIRLIIFILSNKQIELFNATELICFGLAIQISCIYFSIGQVNAPTQNKSIFYTTASILFIVILSILYSLTMGLFEVLNIDHVKLFIGIICAISLYVGHDSVKCAIILQKMKL